MTRIHSNKFIFTCNWLHEWSHFVMAKLLGIKVEKVCFYQDGAGVCPVYPEKPKTGIFTRKLTHEEQKEILSELFGFYFDDDVLYDGDGNEFYAELKNGKFGFSTLKEIFKYHAFINQQKVMDDMQFRFRSLLGIK